MRTHVCETNLIKYNKFVLAFVALLSFLFDEDVAQLVRVEVLLADRPLEQSLDVKGLGIDASPVVELNTFLAALKHRACLLVGVKIKHGIDNSQGESFRGTRLSANKQRNM